MAFLRRLADFFRERVQHLTTEDGPRLPNKHVASQNMFTLILAYALLGIVTLAALLSIVNWMAEPDQRVPMVCILLAVAIWPMIWLKLIRNIALVAVEDLRVPAQRTLSSFSRKPRLLGQRFAVERSAELATR